MTTRHITAPYGDTHNMTPPAQPGSRPATSRNRWLPWVIIGPAVALLAGVAIAAAMPDDEVGTPTRTADPDGFLSKVETYMKQRVPEDYEQRLIATGRELCEMGIDGTDVGQGRRARAVFARHDAEDYSNNWPYVSGAADEYLC